MTALMFGVLIPPSPLSAETLYVVSHGWHTGLAIRRGDIPDGVWPEHAQAPPGEYLEVGWGEREFYQTRDPSLLQALRAALWPSPGVLHLAGFNGPVAERFPHSQVLAIEADAAAMARVARYISDAYERDQAGNVKRMGRGLYGDSRFFCRARKFPSAAHLQCLDGAGAAPCRLPGGRGRHGGKCDGRSGQMRRPRKDRQVTTLTGKRLTARRSI